MSKKYLTKDEVYNFTQNEKTVLQRILDNPNSNERDDLLPFFRQFPLPLILSTVHFPEFCWIEWEFDFNRQYRADFVISTSTSMGNDYHLIELEQHNFKYFTSKGEDVSSKYSHTLTQIIDWNVFWDNNQEYLTNKLKPIQRRLYTPRNYIIMGRRGDLKEEIIQKYAFLAKAIPSLSIMSFDRLIDACDTAIELTKSKAL